jgi:TolB-like protein
MNRSRLVQLFALVAIVALGAVHAPAAPARKRIGVFPMQSEVREVTGARLEGAVTDALLRLSRFDVVARTQMDKVLAEQKLSNSDVVDPESAIRIGKLLGADYVVTGTLLSTAFEPGFFSKDEFTARARIEVIEAATGRIVFSDSFAGARKTLVMRRGTSLSTLSPAERERSLTESLAALASRFVARLDLLDPLTGYVVKVEGRRVAINLGRDSGVKAGQEFLVVDEAEPVRDPATGETLSVDRRTRARLAIVSVEEKLAWARVVATSSPNASVDAGGELVDATVVPGIVAASQTVVQTEPRSEEIAAAVDRAKRRKPR